MERFPAASMTLHAVAGAVGSSLSSVSRAPSLHMTSNKDPSVSRVPVGSTGSSGLIGSRTISSVTANRGRNTCGETKRKSFSRLQRRLQQTILSNGFHTVIATLITLGTILIGIETAWMTRHGNPNDFHGALQVSIGIGLLSEMILRIMAGVSEFCFGSDRRWEWFDFIMGIWFVGGLVGSGLKFENLDVLRFLHFGQGVVSLSQTPTASVVRERTVPGPRDVQRGPLGWQVVNILQSQGEGPAPTWL